jgi:hypothetical protein
MTGQGDPTGDRALRYEGLCWPTAEQRLLLRCLHLQAKAEARQAYRAWRRRIDLATLDAGSLALMPLLGVRLHELGVVDELAPLLAGARRRSWCHGQLLLRGALRAVDRLASRGIPLVALKGLPLLEAYGGNLGLRPMSDVDLLLPRASARDAFAALGEDGFEVHPRLDPGELASKLDSFHGWSVKAGHVEVDLHWASLIEDLSPDADAGLWRRAERWTFEGRALLRPSPTDLLLHVCVHGARWSRTMSVLWVPDVLRLLARQGQSGGIDWPCLVAEAHARSLELALRETLRFVREELAAPVPVDVLAALVPPEPSWIFWCDHHAFSADPRTSTALHRAAAKAVAKLRAGQPVAGIPALVGQGRSFPGPEHG